MYKKSRKMILVMLGICMFFVCGLTVAHVFTSSQNVNTSQTSGGWGGVVYGSYDGYTHQLSLTTDVIPGSSGALPTMASFPYYFKVFQNGTQVFDASNTLLGYNLVNNGSILPFSTNLNSFGSIPDGNITVSLAMGGTAYTSRYNYFGNTVYLNLTGDNKPDLNTSIVGENVTVNSGDSVTYKVRLIDSNGNPVNNALIVLSANGEDHTVTTAADGYASYDFTNIKGSMNVTATFNDMEGSNCWYLSSTGSFTITVNPNGGNGNSTDDGSNGGHGGFDSVYPTGIPLVILLIACLIGGTYYYKRK